MNPSTSAAVATNKQPRCVCGFTREEHEHGWYGHHRFAPPPSRAVWLVSMAVAWSLGVTFWPLVLLVHDIGASSTKVQAMDPIVITVPVSGPAWECATVFDSTTDVVLGGKCFVLHPGDRTPVFMFDVDMNTWGWKHADDDDASPQ